MRMRKPQVGMIGLGIMGSAMAANLMRAGFRVVGYDPDPACRRRHARAGGIVAGSAAEASKAAAILICSLPSEKALEAPSDLPQAVPTTLPAGGAPTTTAPASGSTVVPASSTVPASTKAPASTAPASTAVATTTQG